METFEPGIRDVWLSQRSDARLILQTLEKGEGEFPHQPEFWLYLGLRGGGRIIRRSTAQNSDGLFLPGTVGVGSPHDGGQGCWCTSTFVGLAMSQERLNALILELPGQKLDMEAISSNFHRNILLNSVIQEAYDLAELHALSTAFIDHALAVIVHQLVRSTQSIKSFSHGKLTKNELQVITDYIQENIYEDISVGDLADILSLTPNHFSHRFRATTGLAPYQFVTCLRLDRAADLLISTQLTVTEIGLMVGYPSPGHLSAAFRRYKGASPVMWRRSQRS